MGLLSASTTHFSSFFVAFVATKDTTRQTCCLKWKIVYNSSRALGIEHTPFEASFGFNLEEPPDLVSVCDLQFRFRKTRQSG
jgi:hypothetical protein